MSSSHAVFKVSITSDKIVKTTISSDLYKGVSRLGLACPCKGTGVIQGSADKLHKECRMVLQHAKRFSNRSSSTQDALRTELRGRLWSGDRIRQSIALNTLFIIKDIPSLLACLYHPDDILKAEAHTFLMNSFVCTEAAREALLLMRDIGSKPKLKEQFEVIRGRDITAMSEHAQAWLEAVLEKLKLIPVAEPETVKKKNGNPPVDTDPGVYEYESTDMNSSGALKSTQTNESVEAGLKDVRDRDKVKELTPSDLAKKFYEIFTNGDVFRVSNELLSIIFFSDGKEKLKAGGSEFLNRLTDHEKRIFFLCGISFDNRSIALKSYKMLSQKLKVSEEDGDERLLAVLERTRTRLEKNRKLKLPVIERYLHQLMQLFYPPAVQEPPQDSGQHGLERRPAVDAASDQAAAAIPRVRSETAQDSETEPVAASMNPVPQAPESVLQPDSLLPEESRPKPTSEPAENQKDIEGVKQELNSLHVRGLTFWERVVLFCRRFFRRRK